MWKTKLGFFAALMSGLLSVGSVVGAYICQMSLIGTVTTTATLVGIGLTGFVSGLVFSVGAALLLAWSFINKSKHDGKNSESVKALGKPEKNQGSCPILEIDKKDPSYNRGQRFFEPKVPVKETIEVKPSIFNCHH